MNNQEETTTLNTYLVTIPGNSTTFVVKGTDTEYGTDGTELEILNGEEAVAFFPQFTSWIEVTE